MWVLIRCGPCRKIHGFCRFVSLKSKRNLQGSLMEGGKLPRCLHLKVLSTSSNGKTFNLPDHVWHSSVPRTLSPTVNDIIGIKAQVLKTGSEILYRGARFVECREMRIRSISWSDYVCKEKNRKKIYTLTLWIEEMVAERCRGTTGRWVLLWLFQGLLPYRSISRVSFSMWWTFQPHICF